MQQTRLMSLVESFANVVVSFGLAFLAQLLVFPAIGLQATVMQSVKLSLVFTLVSIGRGYLLRRLFEVLGRRG